MTDVEALANRHPYVIKPGAKQAAGWAGCIAVGAVLGFCCINPDGGDYGVWVPDVQQMLDRWRPTFQQRGCALSFVHQRYGFCVVVRVIVYGMTHCCTVNICIMLTTLATQEFLHPNRRGSQCPSSIHEKSLVLHVMHSKWVLPMLCCVL